MSKYTTELRFICESVSGLEESKGFTDIDNIITQAAPLIFNFDFPIYDENYKLPFEKMILRHFYTREIAYETYGLWKLKLWDKLNLIMPYYNEMYKSTLLEFNPLYDTDYTVNHMGEGSGTNADNEQVTEAKSRRGNLSGTDSNTRWDLYSDTPQGGIDVITRDSDGVDRNTYLTDARKITDNGNTSRATSDTENNTIGRNRNGNVTSMDKYTDRVFGKRGVISYSKMIKEFRETFLRIDEMVCEELEELFLGLW
jgi:hypothetical protein